MVVSLPKKIVLLLCTAVFYTTGAFAYDSVNPERNAAVPQGQIEWKPVFPRALFLNKPEISVMETGGLAGPIEYQDILRTGVIFSLPRLQSTCRFDGRGTHTTPALPQRQCTALQYR